MVFLECGPPGKAEDLTCPNPVLPYCYVLVVVPFQQPAACRVSEHDRPTEDWFSNVKTRRASIKRQSLRLLLKIRFPAKEGFLLAHLSKGRKRQERDS